MRLNSFEALDAFAKQLERNIADGEFRTKVVVTPSSINEKGVVIKVSLLKTFIQDRRKAANSCRTLRLRVSVAGTAESMTGLKQALAAIEALDRYLITPDLRLEAAGSAGVMHTVPNSRIVQAVSEEDSFNMVKTISREKTYIPKFDKNRELPSNEQIAVTYKAATIELKNRIVSKPTAIGDFDDAGKSRGMKIEFKVDDESYLRNMIVSISGAAYQEGEGGEVKYIRTAADLLKAPICFEPLIAELVEHFREELTVTAVNEKN